jgi:diguanylate cyclase (GGDEF)-like protein/PAS domain S-box-containing protein
MQPDFRQFVELLRDVVIVTEAAPVDGEGPPIVYVNPAFTRLTGYAPEEVLGRSVCLLRGPGTDADVVARMRAALARGESVREVLLNYGKEGHGCWMDLSVKPMRDARGEITHYAAIERDVSAHKAIERRLQAAVDTDPLTGLSSRRAFLDLAEGDRRHARADGRGFAVVLLDIDHFRSINGTHGYEIGDDLLGQVGEALRSAVGTRHRAGRISGDEFAVAMAGAGPDEAQSLAQHVRAAIRRVRLPGLPWLGVTASFGVACTEHEDVDLQGLLSRAERACDESRRAGRNRVTLDRIYGKVIPFRARKPAPPDLALVSSPLLME